MSKQTFWIAVDDDGQATRSEAKPVNDTWARGRQFWRVPFPYDPLPEVGENETIFGVGRGQCAQFKLVRIGEIIDGKTEATG